MKGRGYDARNNCIIGAVKDFIAYYHSSELGKTLCAILEVSLRESCMTTAKGLSVGAR
jgi:hypothetical protein